MNNINELKNKSNIKRALIPLILLTVILIIIDQTAKHIAEITLISGDISLINEFFYLELVHNRGAAFGILENSRLFFCVITLIFVIALELFYIRIPAKKEYKILRYDLIILLSGAVGNLIDRIKCGYVVDFLAFDFGSYKFPRFNVADIYVCVSAAILFILIIFVYSDEQLHDILNMKGKSRI